jgi:peptidyl-prolyl cis-trans isomerase D
MWPIGAPSFNVPFTDDVIFEVVEVAEAAIEEQKMLEKVREPWRASKVKSFLAYTVFFLICLTFVFVGFNPNQGGGGLGAAASVNDKVISFFDLQERVTAMESQLQGKMPAAQRQAYDKMIRESALEELINYELVSQSAEKIGIMPTAEGTRDIIVNIPPFQDNGRFSRELYDRYLT